MGEVRGVVDTWCDRGSVGDRRPGAFRLMDRETAAGVAVELLYEAGLSPADMVALKEVAIDLILRSRDDAVRWTETED